jgi:hypothetical protein
MKKIYINDAPHTGRTQSGGRELDAQNIVGRHILQKWVNFVENYEKIPTIFKSLSKIYHLR